VEEIMEKKCLVMTVALLLLFPLAISAQEKKNYLAARAGLYTFTDSLDEADFKTGFDGAVLYGYYLKRNFVLEGGVGYFHDGVNRDFGNEISGIPITLTAKGLYHGRKVELFAGGGVGVYFAEFHGKVKNGFVDSATDTVFGGHIVAGGTMDLLRAFFIGLEGKYIFTDTADFTVKRSRLDGFIISTFLGFRF
jgi:hypothetical protein